MVDLGISRTQDIQNPMAANIPTARPPADAGERSAKAPGTKAPKAPAAPPAIRAGNPADLEGDVKRLNELLGGSTRIQFVINRSTNDVYVEVVDKVSNKVLKTIPPSEVPAVASKLSGGGILVDNKS